MVYNIDKIADNIVFLDGKIAELKLDSLQIILDKKTLSKAALYGSLISGMAYILYLADKDEKYKDLISKYAPYSYLIKNDNNYVELDENALDITINKLN